MDALIQDTISILPQEAGVLPFTCLVLAPLLPADQLDGLSQPISITVDNFDQAMTKLKPRLVVDFENEFLCDIFGVARQPVNVDYSITCRADFSPRHVIERDDRLRALSQLINSLAERLQLNTEYYDVEDLNPQGLKIDELDVDQASRESLELLVCELQDQLSVVLDQILHNPAWQQIESAWRGLYWLCESNEGLKNCKIEFLPVSRELLWEDLNAVSSVEDSHLYEMLYTQSYGQFGGVPYGALMLDDYFSGSGHDLVLLRQLSQIALLAHVPLVTGTAPTMLGVDSFRELAGADGLAELHRGARYIKWRSFLATTEASYLALTLPRIRIRGAYSQTAAPAQADHSMPWFDEYIADDNEHCLWLNACYPFVINLMESFSKHGFCSAIAGVGHGDIDCSTFASLDENLPVEYVLSESKEADLITLGFNPIGTRHHAHRLVFQTANSVRWGIVNLEHRQQTVDSLASAKFQYLLIVLRVIHCIKIIFRDSVGTFENAPSIENLLNRWVRQYVSDVESPSQTLRSKRPLRDARINVLVGNEPGWYDISLALQPHLKYMGEGVEIAVHVPVHEAVA